MMSMLADALEPDGKHDDALKHVVEHAGHELDDVDALKPDDAVGLKHDCKYDAALQLCDDDTVVHPDDGATFEFCEQDF